LTLIGNKSLGENPELIVNPKIHFDSSNIGEISKTGGPSKDYLIGSKRQKGFAEKLNTNRALKGLFDASHT